VYLRPRLAKTRIFPATCRARKQARLQGRSLNWSNGFCAFGPPGKPFVPQLEPLLNLDRPDAFRARTSGATACWPGSTKTIARKIRVKPICWLALRLELAYRIQTEALDLGQDLSENPIHKKAPYGPAIQSAAFGDQCRWRDAGRKGCAVPVYCDDVGCHGDITNITPHGSTQKILALRFAHRSEATRLVRRVLSW